jgi:radical SAM superfamily enzyme YgiQ (UPF0313 family)
MNPNYKILLVYPEYPDTFWSFKYALKFIYKKASFPPLGLLTVAAMLPEKWGKKLIDMNVNPLRDRDIQWADFVFISAMDIQESSVRKVVNRCKALGIKMVAGGPLFSIRHKDFDDIEHLVLNEAEITLPSFLEDLMNGYPKHIYDSSDHWPDIQNTLLPQWDLINLKKYATMNIQYSRGCPYDCEFCDITLLNGRKIRTKTKDQIIKELECLYQNGWRGAVFIVDDNFIGNKRKLKKEILPAITEWMEQKKYPFYFNIQASIELSDDDELMKLMVNAGFNKVFIGIETPDENSLTECNKYHNKNRDLIYCIQKMHRCGLQVQGGFIVGFDNDPLSIFETQIKFIQESGIVTAMVSLLNALPKTKLHNRLIKEKRLLKVSSGDNTDFSLNFIPKMDAEKLINGYKKILNTIYSPKHYYKRVKTFLKVYKPIPKNKFRFTLNDQIALIKSIIYLGILGEMRFHYWRLFFWTIFKHPKLFSLAITFSIYGFHFQKIVNRQIKVD